MTPMRIAAPPKNTKKKPPGVVNSANNKRKPSMTQSHQTMIHLTCAIERARIVGRPNNPARTSLTAGWKIDINPPPNDSFEKLRTIRFACERISFLLPCQVKNEPYPYLL